MQKPTIPPPCWELFDAEMVSITAGHAVIQFTTKASHANPYGTVQGGLLAAMIDNCIGPAVFALHPERQSATIELKVNYLAPARPDELVRGEAKVVRSGVSTAYIEVSLTDAEGELLARASATNIFLGEVDVAADIREALS